MARSRRIEGQGNLWSEAQKAESLQRRRRHRKPAKPGGSHFAEDQYPAGLFGQITNPEIGIFLFGWVAADAPFVPSDNKFQKIGISPIASFSFSSVPTGSPLH